MSADDPEPTRVPVGLGGVIKRRLWLTKSPEYVLAALTVSRKLHCHIIPRGKKESDGAVSQNAVPFVRRAELCLIS